MVVINYVAAPGVNEHHPNKCAFHNSNIETHSTKIDWLFIIEYSFVNQFNAGYVMLRLAFATKTTMTATCARSLSFSWMSSSVLSTFEYTANDNTCQNHLSPKLCNFKYFNCVRSCRATLNLFRSRRVNCGTVAVTKTRNSVNAKEMRTNTNSVPWPCVQNFECILRCWMFLFRKFVAIRYPCHTNSTFNLCFISIWCQELWHKIRPMRQ